MNSISKYVAKGSKENNYLFHEFCVYNIIIIISTNIISSFKLKYIDSKKRNLDD